MDARAIAGYLSELQKRAQDDPINAYEMHAKQRAFRDAVIDGPCHMNLALWANRAGKSDVGAEIDAEIARFGNPNARTAYSGGMEITDRAASVWVVSLDFPSSRDIMQPKIFDNGNVPPGGNKPFIPAREIKPGADGWRKQDQVLHLKNGSIVGFKCLRGDQPVLMSDGVYKSIKDVAEGEQVAVRTKHGRAGLRDRVAEVGTKFSGKIAPLLKITFRGGRTIVCSAEHKIFNGLSWKKAGTYQCGDTIPYYGTPEPENPKQLAYSPWLLGFLIGDGGLTGKQVRATVADPLVLNRLQAECDETGIYLRPSKAEYAYTLSLGVETCGFSQERDSRGYAVAAKTSPLIDWLRELDLWGKKSVDKHVPDEVFRASNKDVALFLSGLFAADGTITNKPSASYATSSHELAIGVRRLLDRFRVRSSIQYIRSTNSWRVVTSGKIHLGRFLRAVEWIKYPEKAKQWVDWPEAKTPMLLRVKAIEEVAAAPVYDISIPETKSYMVEGILVHNSCDSGREKFQGTGKDAIHFDEEPPKEIYEEAVMRIEGGRKLEVFFTCTLLPPSGEKGGVSWVYTDMVKPWKRGETVGFEIHQASIYDNPHIGKSEIEFLESLYPIGSVQRRIRLEGELLPGLSGSRVYGNFNPELHVREQGSLNPNLPLVWFWDFNVMPMVTGIGQRNGSMFRVFDELVLEDDASIDHMVELFWETYSDWKGPIQIYGDQTGEGRNVQTSETNYTLIMNAMKAHGRYPKLRLPSKNPFIKDRINAVNYALLDEFGERRVEIDPRCKELILDLEDVLADPRGLIKKVTNQSDPYYKRTHACLAGNTLIETCNGKVLLSTIRVGDLVRTPTGERRVLAAGVVKRDRVVRIKLSTGECLQATKEHKFFTERGLVRSDELVYSDVLLSPGHRLCQNKQLIMRADDIGYRATIIERTGAKGTDCQRRSSTSIVGRGKIITAQFLMGAISIIKTGIGTTTRSRTWNVLMGQNICPTTAPIAIGCNQGKQRLSSTSTGRKRRNGMGRKPGLNGIVSTLKEYGRLGKEAKKPANDVGSPTSPFCRNDPSIVQEGASQALDMRPGLTMNHEPASFAERLLKLIGIRQHKPVRVVAVEPLASEIEVYDLTVEHDHCYYANGVLVSNSDAFGYWVAYEAPVAVKNNNQTIITTVRDPSYKH